MPPDPAPMLAHADRLTTTSRGVAAKSAELDKAKGQRTTAILAARQAGMSLGQIAVHVGLSKAAVQQIANRG